MKVVLAGASGFLGQPLVRSLSADGHDVVLLTRGSKGPGPGVRTVTWNPDGTAGAWAEALDGADAVVNLAGESIAEGRWTPARKAALTESRLLSTRSLVAAITLAKTQPPVLVSSSAVGYYGPHGDEPVTETDGASDDFLGRLSLEWERAAQAAESGGTRVVLVRTGLVLERDGGALKAMLPPFRFCVGGPLGSGSQYWPWIHRADWVALMRFLLLHPNVQGPVNLTAPVPVTNEEFSRTLARVLGRPCLFRAPAFVLRLAMGEMADALLLTGQRVVPARAQELGFRFTYETLEPALRAILS